MKKTHVGLANDFYAGIKYVLHNGELIESKPESGEFEEDDSSAMEITGVCQALKIKLPVGLFP